jgi:hypothetical protein
MSESRECGPGVPADWRCPECRCLSYARVAEQKPDGSFGPGPLIRCVECKSVSDTRLHMADPKSFAPALEEGEGKAGATALPSGHSRAEPAGGLGASPECPSRGPRAPAAPHEQPQRLDEASRAYAKAAAARHDATMAYHTCWDGQAARGIQPRDMDLAAAVENSRKAQSAESLAIVDLCQAAKVFAEAPGLAAASGSGGWKTGCGYPDVGPELEAAARALAAFQIASEDPTGARLPEDVWHQAVPEAWAAISALPLLSDLPPAVLREPGNGGEA